MSYDHILKKRKLDFKTFKTIYGHSDKVGQRTVRLGNETLIVDN